MNHRWNFGTHNYHAVKDTATENAFLRQFGRMGGCGCAASTEDNVEESSSVYPTSQFPIRSLSNIICCYQWWLMAGAQEHLYPRAKMRKKKTIVSEKIVSEKHQQNHQAKPRDL